MIQLAEVSGQAQTTLGVEMDIYLDCEFSDLEFSHDCAQQADNFSIWDHGIP